MGYRQTWMFVIGTGISGTIWWFWLYWGPDFLLKQYHMDIKNLGLPMVVVYFITGVGSIVGGWLSGRFIKLGWSINAARKPQCWFVPCAWSRYFWRQLFPIHG